MAGDVNPGPRTFNGEKLAAGLNLEEFAAAAAFVTEAACADTPEPSDGVPE